MWEIQSQKCDKGTQAQNVIIDLTFNSVFKSLKLILCFVVGCI